MVMKPPQIVVHDTIAVLQPTADGTPSSAAAVAAADDEVVPEGGRGSSTVAVLGEGDDDEAHEAEKTAATQEDPKMARPSCGTATEERPQQQVLLQQEDINLPSVVVHASAE